MASSTATSGGYVDKQSTGSSIPKSKRKLQKHLRSAGLEYISRTGKIIPAKRVSDELCQCPQKCDERVPQSARQRLFAHFYGLGEADLQNNFLRQNMDLRARLNIPDTTTTSSPSTGSGRSPRRITCKYLVPLLPDEDDTVEVCQKAFVSAFVITTKRVRLQREKLIASLGLNSYSSHNRGKGTTNNNNLTTANNNIAAVVDSLRKDPVSRPNRDVIDFASLSPSSTGSGSSLSEQLLAKLQQQQPKSPDSVRARTPPTSKKAKQQRLLVDNPLIPLGLLVPDGVTIAPVYNHQTNDRDLAIVHNFFSNQLWKPEYIGAYS